MQQIKINLENEDVTIKFGARLSQLIRPPLVIYLTGDLGAGKTTLSRGLIQGLGHGGAVKSPTYTLVEPYELADIEVYHFDLYRLADPEELEFMGIRDYFSKSSLCIIEWPERGQGLLPNPDLALHLAYDGQGRALTMQAGSQAGVDIIEQLK